VEAGEERENGRAPRMGIRRTLLAAFGLIVLGGGALSLLLGYQTTSEAVVGEAQRRVEMDLRGAWATYNHEMDRIRSAVKFTSMIQKSHEVLSETTFDLELTRIRLELLRKQNRLDVLTLVDPNGRVVLRTRYPYESRDMAYMDPAMQHAFDTKTSGAGTVIVPADVLRREGQHLAEAAFIEVQPTPMAAPSPKDVETDGMMLKAVEAVFDDSNRVIGYVYGGVLLNRNYALLDAIRETVFKNEEYDGRPLGTATIFQGDLRIATNVRNEAGNRAIGTRVSRVVRDAVLENGRPFNDRAFVVNDWYLTAYDPIRAPDGQVIGILYLGVLEKKFLEYRDRLTGGFVLLALIGTGLALVFSLVFAGWIYRPIRRLTRAAREVSHGQSAQVRLAGSRFNELYSLSHAFNEMAGAVARRTEELRAANGALQRSNADLTRLNQNYMEMLGFVSHELKSPIASAIFGVSSLRDGYFGAIQPGQADTLESIERNLEHLNEMIQRYLTLSRIEQGDLACRPRRIGFRKMVLDPSMDQVARQAAAAGLTVCCDVPEDLVVEGDPDLLRIVMDNLLSNALKYGRSGTEVRVGHARLADGAHAFSVRNEGRGIPADQMPYLFRKFSRLDVAEAAHRRGTGLGLFITREIVELHGGRVRVESAENECTTFVVELPGGGAAGAPTPPAPT